MHKTFYIQVTKKLQEDHDQPRQGLKRTTQQRRSFTPGCINVFYGHCFKCTNFEHKTMNFKTYEINVQERDSYVGPHDIECYKFYNYGHTT
jgi:hypothetical protein